MDITVKLLQLESIPWVIDGKFKPDASGYVLKLVDGTLSRLRFRKVVEVGGRRACEFPRLDAAVPVVLGRALE